MVSAWISTGIDGFGMEHNRILWFRHGKSTHEKLFPVNRNKNASGLVEELSLAGFGIVFPVTLRFSRLTGKNRQRAGPGNYLGTDPGAFFPVTLRFFRLTGTRTPAGRL